MKFTGKVWKFGPDINTDLILPGPLQLSPPEEQARAVFQSNRPGWVDEVSDGDIIVAGANFGMGSSRPAARSLRNLGLACLVAESINGLFFRNCINWGFPALECPGAFDAFEEGDDAVISLDDFTVRNAASNIVLNAGEIPSSLMATLDAGGLYPQLEAEGLIAPVK
ncbi:MAG: LeuD/DmdB family oxidoreductase small subunit [Alphaproteobacteria bacterium]